MKTIDTTVSIVFYIEPPVDESCACRPLAGAIERLPSAGDAGQHRAVPHIAFTPQLRRFTATPALQCSADNLRTLLDEAFALNPQLRGYVLDDQGHLRANVVVFIDGRRSADRTKLADRLSPDSRVFVMQALSGG